MKSLVKSLVYMGGFLGLALVSTMVFGESGGNLGTMATKVSQQAASVAKLMNIAAYVAGVGFALAGILQFKAHKENPQGTPLSKPIVLVVVAACLLFLPTILDVAGSSLFEGGKKAAAVGGIDEGGK